MIDNNSHIRFCLFRATQHPEPKIDENVLKGWLNPCFRRTCVSKAHNI